MSICDQIRRDIEAKIMSGEWPPGYRLPNEHEFAADYGCARATVSKATAALHAAGLIERRRKAGSFVAKPLVHSAVFDVPDLGRQIAGSTGSHQFVVCESVTSRGDPLPGEFATLPQIRRVEGIHLGNGEPFGHEFRLINAGAVPAARDTDFDGLSPGAWLLEHVPWSDARHRISAIAAERATASVLGIRPGAACLQIERWTWRRDDPITYVRQIFPGDRFDLVESFTPDATRFANK